MQTTGKNNYRRTGERLGVDLVANPDLLATDFTLGWKTAMLEWSALDLGRFARELGPTHEAVLKISRGINVGNVNSSVQPNGFADRKKQFEKIWKAIGGPYSGITAKLDPAADGVLEEGEAGDAVTDLRISLARLGYAVGEPDGVFGPRTVAAVAAFQAREKLGGEPGKYRVEWAPQLTAAKAVAVAIATYLGLDTAAGQAGLQLQQNLFDLRMVSPRVRGCGIRAPKPEPFY